MRYRHRLPVTNFEIRKETIGAKMAYELFETSIVCDSVNHCSFHQISWSKNSSSWTMIHACFRWAFRNKLDVVSAIFLIHHQIFALQSTFATSNIHLQFSSSTHPLSLSLSLSLYIWGAIFNIWIMYNFFIFVCWRRPRKEQNVTTWFKRCSSDPRLWLQLQCWSKLLQADFR